MFEGGEEWLQTSLDGYLRNLTLMEENKINLLSEEAIYNGMLGALTAGLFETPGMMNRIVSGRQNQGMTRMTKGNISSNNKDDMLEFERYKVILGDNAPKTFDEFRNLKYNNVKEWDYTKSFAEYLTNYPSSNKKYFDAMIELKKKGIKRGNILPAIQKQAYVLPEGNYDSYHIMKRMKERNITDDDLRILMKEAKCMISQWNGQRQVFVGEKGACVITRRDNEWYFKTAWLRNDFGEEYDIILEVLKNVGL